MSPEEQVWMEEQIRKVTEMERKEKEEEEARWRRIYGEGSSSAQTILNQGLNFMAEGEIWVASEGAGTAATQVDFVETQEGLAGETRRQQQSPEAIQPQEEPADSSSSEEYAEIRAASPVPHHSAKQKKAEKFDVGDLLLILGKKLKQELERDARTAKKLGELSKKIDKLAEAAARREKEEQAHLKEIPELVKQMGEMRRAVDKQNEVLTNLKAGENLEENLRQLVRHIPTLVRTERLSSFQEHLTTLVGDIRNDVSMRCTRVGLGVNEVLHSILPVLQANNKALEEQKNINKVMMECIHKFHQDHTAELKALRIDVNMARGAAREAEERSSNVEGTLSQLKKSLKERTER